MFIEAWGKLAMWHLSGVNEISSYNSIQPRYSGARNLVPESRGYTRFYRSADNESVFRVTRQAKEQLETAPKIDYRLLHDKVDHLYLCILFMECTI